MGSVRLNFILRPATSDAALFLALVLHLTAQMVEEAEGGGVPETLGGLAEQVVNLAFRQETAIAQGMKQGDGHCQRH